MSDVAIIGIGLHPFGRFGDKSAFEMGAEAIELALADAGVEWKDVQFAVGGSWEMAQTDPLTGLVGLTGIPFTNVFNACATAASAINTPLNVKSVRRTFVMTGLQERWGAWAAPGGPPFGNEASVGRHVGQAVQFLV